MLPALPPAMIVPNASLQRVDGHMGVWLIQDNTLHFAPVKVGATDLDGQAQILEGIKSGDRVVVYSRRALTARSRIHVVERLAGVSP